MQVVASFCGAVSHLQVRPEVIAWAHERENPAQPVFTIEQKPHPALVDAVDELGRIALMVEALPRPPLNPPEAKLLNKGPNLIVVYEGGVAGPKFLGLLSCFLAGGGHPPIQSRRP